MAIGYTKKEINPDELPEIEDLIDAKAALNAFVAQNMEVIVQYKNLQDEVDSLITTAKKKLAEMVGDVRSPIGPSCGPIRFNGFRTKDVDAGAAYEILGPGLFSVIGGSAEERVVYEVDRTKLHSALAGGLVPKGIDVSSFVSYSPSFTVEK